MNLSDFNHKHNASQEEMVRGLIDQLDAYIAQYHGGRVEFVSLKDDTLTVRMGGACEKCPLQTSTLRGWVEGTLHQFFPDIQRVINTEN
jgi:Fe-S cluster biogenesis protein NfuA